jgi:hypothetical protein
MAFSKARTARTSLRAVRHVSRKICLIDVSFHRTPCSADWLRGHCLRQPTTLNGARRARSRDFDGDFEAVGLTFDERQLVTVEAADAHDAVPMADVAVVQDQVL